MRILRVQKAFPLAATMLGLSVISSPAEMTTGTHSEQPLFQDPRSIKPNGPLNPVSVARSGQVYCRCSRDGKARCSPATTRIQRAPSTGWLCSAAFSLNP